METHLSDLTVSLRRRRRGNERKARISEIPGVGKGLTEKHCFSVNVYTISTQTRHDHE